MREHDEYDLDVETSDALTDEVGGYTHMWMAHFGLTASGSPTSKHLPSVP